jgi:hypothetical protein
MVGGCTLKPGEIVRIGAAASVQFAGDRALTLRVIRVHDWPTYHGWCWLDGYVLDQRGEAVERRELYVQLAGLRRLRAPVLKPARHRRP